MSPIGTRAIAPPDPNTIYVGSSEADMRSDIAHGNGMYKSTDAGKHWAFIGLADSRQIGRILVNSHNPDVVFVAALGHAYGPNATRGVFRSTNGGGSWTKVLSKNDDTGAPAKAGDRRRRRRRGRVAERLGSRSGDDREFRVGKGQKGRPRRHRRMTASHSHML